MCHYHHSLSRAGVAGFALAVMMALTASPAAAGQPTTSAPARTDVACEPADALVFDDNYGCHVIFEAFAGSKLDALSYDGTVSYLGAASLKVALDVSGPYAGGAFTTDEPRSLVTTNALSFWVKASRAVTLDLVGVGNDNTGTSKYTAQRSAVPITTTWSRVVVPIPLPAKLGAEKGLFFFAEGARGAPALTFWIDEVRFMYDATITNPRPALTPQTLNMFAGSNVALQGATRTTFNVGGVDQTVSHSAGYFTFASSDSAVAWVAGDTIHVVGNGTAILTAKLGEVAATGAITVNATAPPATAAPVPAVPGGNVISLFSNAYPNHPVDTWSATWDQADVADLQIAGDNVKVYTNLVYAGIEFTSQPINASAMTYFHTDVWIPAGTLFRVKLVDFGPNGVYGGGDDSEHELTFSAGSTPPLVTGTWLGLDMPLSSFTNLTSRAHLAQLLFSGNTPTVFVDNIYFHNAVLGVDEDGPAGFELRGVTPNPAQRELRARFSLRDSRPATLSLFDVSGRLLEARRVDSMGPGWHFLSLGAGKNLPAGIYILRLAQDGRSLTTRAILMR